jgi:hypothetical protein
VVEVLEISLAEQEPRKSAARGTLNFSELRYGEVRRMPRPRRSVNKGKKKGLRILPRPSWAMGTYCLG